MASMSKRILACLIIITTGSIAAADATYIKEVQGLLDTLTSKDPARVSLTLKLADAEFEEYLKASNNGTNLGGSEVAVLRRTTMKHYTEALTGFGGVFTPVSGGLRGKVQFQMARLYNDEGRTTEAENIWKGLVAQDTLPDLKRESALRLAENLEQVGTPEALKSAENYYGMALKLCASQDVCSYSHYRLGWIYHKQDRINDAVKEVKEALFDAKGQVREEALRDYINFLALVPGDGKESLTTIEALAAKTQRPALIQNLSDALFSAGNRIAGTYILESANKKSPQLKNFARLLEEQYGFRNWEAFNNTLDETTSYLKNTAAVKEAAKDVDTEKIFKRLTVQLDGERTTQPARTGDFKKTVMIYMAVYGRNNMRAHMIDGWLVAETNVDAKIAQLKTWIEEEKAAGATAEEVRLRVTRASEAQKAKKLDIVIEEMAVLKNIDTTPGKRREDAYSEAHAYYELKDYDKALPLFKELAAVDTTAPDKWAIQSENLALDILSQKKAFDQLITQADLWIKNPNFEKWISSSPAHAEELRDLKKISQQATFESATALGETPAALATFKGFCVQDQFMPKSCENARVLAIKMKDEEALLQILKKQNKSEELTSELEASARYSEAAAMLEPGLRAKTATNSDYLKVALLFELSGNIADRDRILNLLIGKLSHGGALGAEEDLIYTTLKDANLLNASSLKLKWKKENHLRLVGALEDSGHGTPETHKILLESCENLGPAWAKIAMGQVESLDKAQRAVKFYGKNSKRKFEVRLAALKKLSKAGDCYLQGADAKTRVLMSTELAQSQTDLAEEIKNSPLPEGLDEASQAQLKATLTELAEPFVIKAKDFQKIAAEQLEKVENPEERLALKEKIGIHEDLTATAQTPATTEAPAVAGAAGQPAGPATTAVSVPAAAKTAPVPAQPATIAKRATASDIQSAIESLHQNPNEAKSLAALKEYYEGLGQVRLAAYYQGRLLQIEKPKEQHGAKEADTKVNGDS